MPVRLKWLTVFLLPVAVIVLGIVGAMSLRIPVPPAQYQDCFKAAQKDHAKQAKCEADETLWHRTFVDPVAYYTAWLTAFTGALATVGIAQGFLIRDQIKLGRDEFNASHRPRLIVRDVFYEAKEETQLVTFILTNAGDAPARVIESALAIELVGDGEFARNANPDGKSDLGSIDLAAGESVTKSLAPGTADRILMLPTNAYRGSRVVGAAHFLGALVYADRDGRKRRMAFQRRHVRDDNTFRGIDNPDAEYSD
jgi:hypothetical protein